MMMVFLGAASDDDEVGDELLVGEHLVQGEEDLLEGEEDVAVEVGVPDGAAYADRDNLGVVFFDFDYFFELVDNVF